jgi:alpha-1,3-rhamnosyl/mannosyltransferase
LGWLELAVAPWLRRFDGVFHGTFNSLPLTSRGPSVLTLHDLAPQVHAEDFRPLTRAAWRVSARGSIRRAGVITTVSEFIRGQIAAHFRIEQSRIAVAPDAVDGRFRPERAAQADELARRLDIEPPYVVAIGGAPRRGLAVALEAWRLANPRLDSPITLVVTRQPGLAPEPGLVSLTSLNDEGWATLLAGARALCYPTRYEGFGLPALEAAASGTPVVCARVASLPEVLGDAGCWAEAPSAPAVAEALVRVLTDPAWHQERREAGLERARQAPSWRDSAAVLLEAYRRAAG